MGAVAVVFLLEVVTQLTDALSHVLLRLAVDLAADQGEGCVLSGPEREGLDRVAGGRAEHE